MPAPLLAIQIQWAKMSLYSSLSVTVKFDSVIRGFYNTRLEIFLIFLMNVEPNRCGLKRQVRDSDPSDPHRQKTIQLLDDFRQPSVNGNRILFADCY